MKKSVLTISILSSLASCTSVTTENEAVQPLTIDELARSNEAKALGIKAGLPYYQLKERFPNGEVTVFSSNYELYGDITDRVMSLVRKAAPAFYRYSIDEGFCNLAGMDHYDLKRLGEDLSAFIWKATRMPVSIGIASTKTLAKVASYYAKHYKGYNHCCMMGSDEQRVNLSSTDPVLLGLAYFLRS